MNNKMINLGLKCLIIVTILYIVLSIFNPLLYSKNYDEKKLSKSVTNEEVNSVIYSYNNYIEACLSQDKAKIKNMLPFIKKFNIKSYDKLFETQKEKEITNIDDYIICDVSKINSNIYQVKSYIKTGNLVDGLEESIVVIKINKLSSSFKVLYDKSLSEEGE